MAFCKLLFPVVLLLLAFCVGCGSSDPRTGLINDFREKNKTNVAKVNKCYSIFQARNGFKTPKDKEELLTFLKGGSVDRNLERVGIDPAAIEEIFVSERDGEPIKVRWGIKVNMNKPSPIAFEAVGVDGVRLVAADVILEVSDDEEYDRLWDGDYTPQGMGMGEGDGPAGAPE